MRNQKEYMVRRNSKTNEYLSNEEVYCRNCGLNFGNIYILQKHRQAGYEDVPICLEPKSIKMTAHVNTYGNVVWKYSKW